MSISEAYNTWATQYDNNVNRTRDLEAEALRNCLDKIEFSSCLEIGCGSGKNTEWFITKASQVTAVDFSPEMLSRAREKISSDRVNFVQADVTHEWIFTTQQYDLVSFSLVLEHIENIDNIFKQASMAVNKGGYIYIGELHPFKQYSGSRARFETEDGHHVLECYNHHISEFVQTAKKHGFTVADLDEYFDDNNRNLVPRILTILLQKNN